MIISFDESSEDVWMCGSIAHTFYFFPQLLLYEFAKKEKKNPTIIR